jgi:hypothetical protein
MAKKTVSKTTKRSARCMVEIDPTINQDIESIRSELGNPKKVTLVTAAILHSIDRVKRGELVMTNGKLCQPS